MPIRLKLFFKRVIFPLIGSIIFLSLAYWLYKIAPSKEISIVLAILVLTIYLFLFEVLPVDLTAITIMVILGLISWQFAFFGMSSELLDINHLFDGFASNAVAINSCLGSCAARPHDFFKRHIRGKATARPPRMTDSLSKA